MPLIASDRNGPILSVCLGRSEARNALSLALEDELEAVLEEAGEDEGVRVVTLRRRGPVLSAGDDLKSGVPTQDLIGFQENAVAPNE
jgi:enoyl-CoA hydratase/carnithine racemase